MNTPYESASANRAVSRSKKIKTKKHFSFIWFFLAWILLISGGVVGAYYYTEQIKEQITLDIYSQTQQQLNQVKNDYEQHIHELDRSITENISFLQAKVDALTELLVFTRDSATDQTDHSNQLYTQLAEVKKQLDELKKNLDVLK